ncbi:isoaspartyl peptidase/L-asparaginase family protein [Brevundimonas sp. SL130]|uniref:isoaspartyl peptidase/L-asparaginase family protein n=1 Tax=Brevundimonas sp. SL130 TaxID=2995143 RepID=UPI00226C8AC3|nr:isoaspartyl peptidase/L-asparaginase [Brevundimonas sp. SL130]WAC59543.1 isoaspartyl peptidase/L-asparaginase [Brevundimonas sp. SL130]
MTRTTRTEPQARRRPAPGRGAVQEWTKIDSKNSESIRLFTPPRAVLAALAALAAAPATAQTPTDAPRWSLAIHGGAGVIERASLTPEQDAAYRAALQRALDAGSAVLARDGSALDAVQAAVQVMEDDPLFNAGRGAVFTAAGRNELDAAVMNGVDLTAGAVAGLTTTRHPVAAARAVMEQSPHVMLIGPGADAFAAQAGLEQVDPSFFFTERRWQGLIKALTEAGLPLPARPAGAPAPGAQAAVAPPLNEKKFGTVGAVALDSQGRLAAATSTGGMTAKRWGRVGDVPIIGAGTYASNADGCAVSATGSGEYFIRSTVARDICRRTADGATVQAAAEAEIADVGAIGGDGGVIVLGLTGTPAFAMNTSGMYRGAVASNTPAHVAIYADED